MGQIVGGAAKPKRCNLNKLSQLGTPAAGEYILVSSDNSMNAAGQGIFDCYIIGNGRDAATVLELKSIDRFAELECEILGIIDDGTTYNTADSTNRVCAYYEIPNVDSIYKIKVTDINLSGSGNKLQLAIRSAKSPYDASYLTYIGERFYTQDTGDIVFEIPESIKATAKYIAVTSFAAYQSASFVVALSYNGGAIDNRITDALSPIVANLQKLNSDDYAIRGIIDDGTTYNEKYGTTRRTCVFYEIPNNDNKYKVNVSNVILPSGVNLLLAIRSDKTPYGATFLGLIGYGRYTQDTGDIIFEIPESLKESAKYISVCQEQANDSLCSFKVSLCDLSSDVQHLQKQIDDINDVIEEIKDDKQVVDKIPYNDTLFVGGRLIKIYNPYKNVGSNQYTGQTHCHTWSYVKSGGVTYKVPIGYTVEQIAAMTEQEREQVVESVNQQFVAAHKTVGYDFMTITNYDTFADYTPKPQVFPENFLWLCNGFEANTGGWDSTGQAEDQGAHIVILNTNFGKIFDGYAPKDVISYCEERNAVAAYAHPFLSMIYSSPDYVKEIKSGLRFIEVFNSLGVYHADVGGVPYIKQGIELDEDFDALLSQGNYTFCLAVSDQRNLGTTDVERNHLKEGCIKVFANSLAIKDIWEALLLGNFYASENVDVELVGISMAENVLTVNVGVAGMTVEFVKEDNTVVSTMVTTSEQTAASYTIVGNEKFIRARIYQQVGTDKTKRIWTQPIFIAPRIID